MTASKRSAKLAQKREPKLTLTTVSTASTPPPLPNLPPPSTNRAVRVQFVDLSKLRKASLKRYKKHFKLDVKADSKTELVAAVNRHFAQMPVREVDVARDFHTFCALHAGRRVADSASTIAAMVNVNTPSPSQPVRSKRATRGTETCAPAVANATGAAPAAAAASASGG